MRIAIIGTDGIPARYGGFETFVEQIAPHLVLLGSQVVVVGSSLGRNEVGVFPKGVDVQNLPLRANGPSSVLFDVMSYWRVHRKVDALLVLGVSAGLFMPMFRLLGRGQRIVVNVDGLESQRTKWTA